MRLASDEGQGAADDAPRAYSDPMASAQQAYRESAPESKEFHAVESSRRTAPAAASADGAGCGRVPLQHVHFDRTLTKARDAGRRHGPPSKIAAGEKPASFPIFFPASEETRVRAQAVETVFEQPAGQLTEPTVFFTLSFYGVPRVESRLFSSRLHSSL